MTKIEECQLTIFDLMDFMFYVEFKIAADGAEAKKKDKELYDKLEVFVAQTQVNKVMHMEWDISNMMFDTYQSYYKAKMYELGIWFDEHEVRQKY